MLKLGEKSIKSLYLGAKSYAKAYLGSKLVFNKIKKPYYCEVEYLESTGKEYINTDVSIDSSLSYELKAAMCETFNGGSYVFCGGRNETATNQRIIVTRFSDSKGDRIIIQRGGFTTQPFVIPDTEYHTYYSSQTEIKIDNISYNSPNVEDSNVPFALFAQNVAGKIDLFSKIRVKILKMWQGSTLVRDYIPVLDWNMRPCLYDKVSGQLFYNQGSGEFLYGREIHEVEYLQSDGNQFIDTKYIIKSLNHKTTIKFGQITGGTTAPYWIAGSQGSGDTRSGGIARITNDETKVGIGIGNIKAGSTTYRADNPTKLTTMSIVSKDTMKFDWIVDDEVIYKDISFGVGSVSGYSEHIWGLNFRGANGYNAICPISLYQLEDDGILVRDMISAIDENGKGFMFDRVTHTIFDNAGSGELKYPPVELEYIEADGTQYIDTGISPTSKTKWEIKFAFTKETNGQLMGAGHAGDYRFNLGIESNKFRFAIGSGWTTVSDKKDTDVHTWVLDVENKSCSLDEITVVSNYSYNFSTTNYHIFLGKRAVGSEYCSIKIYGSKIYDNDTLVRDFMPCVKDGQAGLWDKVNKVFYPNAGTGEFLKGKVV